MKKTSLTLLLLTFWLLVSATTVATQYDVDQYGCTSSEGTYVGVFDFEMGFPFTSSYDECVLHLKATRLSDTTKDSLMWGVLIDETVHYVWVPVTEADDTSYVTYILPSQGVDELFFDAEIGEASYSFFYTSQNSTGIDDEFASLQLILYPNPATTTITTNIEDLTKVDIYDLAGRLVLSHYENNVDVSDLNSGIYTIAVVSQNGQVLIEKLIIERK